MPSTCLPGLWFLFPLTLIAAYVAGSVNFSILFFRLTGRGDPRERFSGNPGVTNVYRQEGALWAAGILLLDLLRASGIALLSARLLPPARIPWCALALIAGNRYPMFHGFRGGKGVANYLGFTLLLAPCAAGCAACVWLVIFGVLREPFLGSFGMVAVLSVGLAGRAGYAPSAVLGVLVLTGWIVYAHRTNLSRFLSGPRKA